MLSLAVQNATKTVRLTRPSRVSALRTASLYHELTGPPPIRLQSRSIQTTTKWRPVQVLDEWVAKEARPISLRQLMVFGRSLTESRLLSSANYVRTELPTRIAHRLRDMQRLPYVVVTNPHISDVYDLYYTAFDMFRRVKEIKTLDENERFCHDIARMLRAHLTVIPKLAMGILECRG
ncbi:branched-chain alpha-ketoacid dehydrogenase [Apiospora arundinis]